MKTSPHQRAERLRLEVEQAEKLAARRVHLEELWVAREAAGVATSSSEKLQLALLGEIEILGGDISLGFRIVEHVERWRAERNAAHIGYAITLCRYAGVPTPPTLKDEAVAVAIAQYEGRADAGSPAKFAKDEAKAWAFHIMAGLCAAGASIEEAASKAAALVARNVPAEAAYKASVLGKQYAAAWKVSGAEEWLKTEVSNDPDILAGWADLRASLPVADYDREGSRN